MNMDKDHPEMEEPSILDYLKSKLRFWEPGQKIELGAQPSAIPQTVAGESPETQPEVLEVVGMPREKTAQAIRYPWRSLLALFLALLGQRAFEPSPNRTVTTGLVLYGFSLAWLILACLHKEWTLTPYPETGTGSDTRRVRRLPLILGIVLSVAALLTLSDNLFTRLNVTLWVLAIFSFVWA
jgi:small-conductance mechanosensitive channel